MPKLGDFKVEAKTRHPRLNIDYNARTHRYDPDYIDPDGYVLRLAALVSTKTIKKIIRLDDLNEKMDTGVDPIGDHLGFPKSRPRPGSNGKPLKPVKVIKYQVLLIPKNVTAFEWEISKVGEGYKKKLSKTIPHNRNGEAITSLGDPRICEAKVPSAGTYIITLRLKGSSATSRKSIKLRDFLVVSVGESYASGEGNPDVPGKPEGFNAHTGFWDFVLIIPAVWKATKEALDWAGDQLKQKFTTLSAAAKAEIDMNPEPLWLEEKAHRSLRSGPARAAKLLENKSKGDMVTFLSFARSGSEIKDGLLGPRTKKVLTIDPESIDSPWSNGLPWPKYKVEYKENDPWVGNIGQIDEVKKTLGKRKIDAFLISIGGNDVGFSGRLSDLVGGDLDFGNLWYPKLMFLDINNSEERKKIEKAVKEKIDTLDNVFKHLADNLKELNIRQVYLTEYPAAYFDKKKNNKVITEGGCGIFKSMFDADIDRSDALLMKNAAIALNKKLKEIAEKYDWIYISGVAKGFSGHGYCAKETFFVGAEESLVTQGDTNGTMHPNAKGHHAYALQIEKAIKKHSINRTTVLEEEIFESVPIKNAIKQLGKELVAK